MSGSFRRVPIPKFNGSIHGAKRRKPGHDLY